LKGHGNDLGKGVGSQYRGGVWDGGLHGGWCRRCRCRETDKKSGIDSGLTGGTYDIMIYNTGRYMYKREKEDGGSLDLGVIWRGQGIVSEMAIVESVGRVKLRP